MVMEMKEHFNECFVMVGEEEEKKKKNQQWI
jgi:hypothetical protein